MKYQFVLLACLLFCTAVFGITDYKKDFSGKVALVTGGSSGIGYQTALELAQFGARVIIVARDLHPNWFNGADAASKINADPLVKQAQGSARFVKTDIRNLTQIKALFDDIKRNENDLHFAVNGAGIGGMNADTIHFGPYYMGEHCPIRNNLYGTIFTLMYETRFMIAKNHSGTIVNIASIDGMSAVDGGAFYSASKWGVIGLTHSAGATYTVAGETPLIRINGISPTLVNTSLAWQQVKFDAEGKQAWEEPYITPSHPYWKKYGQEWIDSLRAKMIAEPHHMADGILYLLSSQSTYSTGSVLVVDRGELA